MQSGAQREVPNDSIGRRTKILHARIEKAIYTAKAYTMNLQEDAL